MATHILHLSKFGRLARTFTTTSVNTSQQFTTLKVDDKTSIATLTLNRPPANALNTGYMVEVQRTIQDLEKTKCRGLILTSASDRIFCAGLDLNECYKPDAASLEVFWCSLQNLWRALFSTPLITVALINGHAIAGGCVLGLCSEYRVMLPNFKIGINETAIGLAVPLWLIDTYTNVVSSRRVAELDLTSSRIYSSDEALKVGLVDELATSKEQALEKAVAFINSYEQHTLTVRSATKRQFREEILKNFEKNRQHDLEIFMRTVQKPDMQAFMGEYLQSMKNKKRGKA
ncbi:enoyl-CoA delta isomerase 1, mitochondrial-like [Anastrepha obliqua]|uniref:enoyl-CoA delta isomerase 1, mitochondrial-like n=1 Tax=Anastrepha obliqua TaxID=95512 RepID=UPI00240A9099|nr:enoyl-CoA delta isomerase 1, mitochondrial-like [Anastrepha obliqua]